MPHRKGYVSQLRCKASVQRRWQVEVLEVLKILTMHGRSICYDRSSPLQEFIDTDKSFNSRTKALFELEFNPVIRAV